MQNLQNLARLRRAVDPVPELQGFDPLTGLTGRELFLDRAEVQWERYQRDHRPLGFLAIDVDRLGLFQSEHGDDDTDAALARVGSMISDSCRRRADLGGRLRTGEFGVLLSEVEETGATAMGERFRAAIEELKLGNDARRLTVSVGVTCLIPPPNRFVSALLIAADRAVQDAKKNGRNRVETYHEL